MAYKFRLAEQRMSRCLNLPDEMYRYFNVLITQIEFTALFSVSDLKSNLCNASLKCNRFILEVIIMGECY